MNQTSSRKEEVLSTAQALFRAHGYQGTSVRDISRALGIEPASLYSHISTKEDLLRDTCFSMGKQLLSAIEEVNDIYFDAEQKLRMAIRFHIEVLTNNMDAAVVFLRDWRYLGKENKAQFMIMRDEYEQGIRVIIQNGINEGLFQETDLQFAALSVLSAVNWIPEWYRKDGTLTSDEIAEKLGNFILSGLRKKTNTNL